MQTSNIIRNIFYILAIASALSACSQKIDGTSLNSFADSVKSMEAKLPPEQAKALDNDLATLMTRKALNLGQLRELTNGMDAKDVHKAAEEAEAQWKAAYLAQVQARIKVLETGEAKNQAELAELAKFSVATDKLNANVKLNMEQGRFDGDAALPVTLQNQTHYPIAEFGYDLTLTVNGIARAPDPWSYRLQKPLAPGAGVTVQITDKNWDSGEGIGYSLSNRVSQAIFDALKDNPNSTFSVALKVTSITSTDGVFHSPRTEPNVELESLKKELADESH